MSATMFPIKEIDPITAAFGATNIADLMPKYADIPAEFKHQTNRWNRVFNDWFFSGASNLKVTPKEGVDKTRAMAHIKAVMRSFEPKHEHKEAGVAFLLDQWFSDVSYDKGEK